MFGAIAGDIIGSVYERQNIKSTEFPLFGEDSRFTDDSVLTIAVAHAILDKLDYADTLKLYGRKYPNAGYGGSFRNWIFSSNNNPYNSWGNGSAMRVSPVGWAFNTAEEVLREAEKSAAVTHNHPEGIKGAQSVALAILMARKGEGKESIKQEIESRFGYNLSRRLSEIRPNYQFDVSCQGSVPESIIAFLESESFEDAVRLGVSIGGDSDTIACIAGSIAEAFYKEIPQHVIAEVKQRLPSDLWEIVGRFDLATNFSNGKLKTNHDALNQLFEAYLKTDYVVKDGTIDLTLRIDEKNSDLDNLLIKYQSVSAAFLTAYNPYSQQLSRLENEKRQGELVSILKAEGYNFLYGYGQSQTEDWSPEPSVLILEINCQTAMEFARQFEQNAFLFIEKSTAPKLISSR